MFKVTNNSISWYYGTHIFSEIIDKVSVANTLATHLIYIIYVFVWQSSLSTETKAHNGSYQLLKSRPIIMQILLFCSRLKLIASVMALFLVVVVQSVPGHAMGLLSVMMDLMNRIALP